MGPAVTRFVRFVAGGYIRAAVGDDVELYDDEMLVLAHVQYDAEADYWLAAPDWSSQRTTPPDLAATIH